MFTASPAEMTIAGLALGAVVVWLDSLTGQPTADDETAWGRVPEQAKPTLALPAPSLMIAQTIPAPEPAPVAVRSAPVPAAAPPAQPVTVRPAPPPPAAQPAPAAFQPAPPQPAAAPLAVQADESPVQPAAPASKPAAAAMNATAPGTSKSGQKGKHNKPHKRG